MTELANERKISRLQKYLSALRKIAGWSAEDLGNFIGVTRQTIVNLENSSVKMSKLHYIAIRAVFDAEARESGNETLQKSLAAFIDRDDIPDTSRDELRDAVNEISSSVGRRKGSAAIRQAISTAALFVGILSGMLYADLLNSQKKPSESSLSPKRN